VTEPDSNLPRVSKAAQAPAIADASTKGDANREAAEWCELLERLEPTLSHDLRGPLNALTLHIELLRRVSEGLEPRPKAERVLRSLEALEREVDRLTQRIDGLMRLIGELRDSPSAFTIATLLEECEHELRTAARHAGVVLRIEGATEGSLRQREALRRALLLVAHDALERTVAGDSIVLSCQLEGGQAEVQVATLRAPTSAAPAAAAARPRSIDSLARSLVGRCGGELEGGGPSWRLRFPVEVDS
jgi:signal transduction histidine kinase